MLFGKKKTAGTVFGQHYHSMLKITKASSITHNSEFELLPAMFVIADYAAASCQKDRRVVAESVMTEIRAIFKNLD